MRSFEIKTNDANQRVDKFLQKSVPLLPKTLMYKYIRIKRIKVNGKRTTIDQRLNEGDLVELYINDEFFEKDEKLEFLSAPSSLQIVYEDEHILLVNKKPGLVVHEDSHITYDTLINRIKHYLYLKGEYNPQNENSFVPSLCNRIDRNTSGIVIAAKTAQALRILNQKIKDREITKNYLCLVHGVMPKKSDTLEHYHYKNEQENKVYIYDKKTDKTKTMITKYKVLETDGKYSLLEIELVTGRTHQIRAHMAYIGHALVGDGKYGSNSENKDSKLKWQALCAYKLTFDFTTDSQELEYLKGRTFELTDVWFKDEFLSGRLN